jgi:hypothetical protein
MRSLKSIGSAGALALVASLMLGGCSAKQDELTVEDVRGKTPELATLTDSEGQFKNREARVVNSYLRALRTDISKVLLLHSNTQLTEPPLP